VVSRVGESVRTSPKLPYSARDATNQHGRTKDSRNEPMGADTQRTEEGDDDKQQQEKPQTVLIPAVRGLRCGHADVLTLVNGKLDSAAMPVGALPHPRL